MKQKRKNPNLQGLSCFDIHLILFYIIWVRFRRPALPRPVHFALVACLCMFILLPVMPAHPLAIPTTIGAGISFALLLQGGNKHWLNSS
jgi:hypothetical protein